MQGKMFWTIFIVLGLIAALRLADLVLSVAPA